MSKVEIDPGARSARVEGGALAGDVCAAAGEHGLAPLAGSSPDVGMVGLEVKQQVDPDDLFLGNHPVR